ISVHFVAPTVEQHQFDTVIRFPSDDLESVVLTITVRCKGIRDFQIRCRHHDRRYRIVAVGWVEHLTYRVRIGICTLFSSGRYVDRSVLVHRQSQMTWCTRRQYDLITDDRIIVQQVIVKHTRCCRTGTSDSDREIVVHRVDRCRMYDDSRYSTVTVVRVEVFTDRVPPSVFACFGLRRYGNSTVRVERQLARIWPVHVRGQGHLIDTCTDVGGGQCRTVQQVIRDDAWHSTTFVTVDRYIIRSGD